MAKTAKAAAPKKKPAPAPKSAAAAKKAPAKKTVAAKAPAKAAKASGKPAAKAAPPKPVAKPAPAAKAAAGAKGKAPAKTAAPAKPVAAKTTPAAVKAGKAPAKPVKPTAVKLTPAQAAEAKMVATKTADVKKPDLKVVEPKATPSLMSKVQKEEGEDEAAPKKKRSEKDPLAGLDKIADPLAKWEALSAKASLIPSVPYKMSGSFEPKTGLQHKVLGWGYVLTAQNDRLEVLFKDGVRILISNYKAP